MFVLMNGPALRFLEPLTLANELIDCGKILFFLLFSEVLGNHSAPLGKLKSKIKNYILKKKKVQDQQEVEQEVPIEDENI